MRALRFGVFELDLEAGQLRKQGLTVKLPPQPLKVLTELARRQGDLVSRDELKELLWGVGIHVEHDRGINFCMNQIRAALGDDADTPRFLETVPRRGYRFIAPVEIIAGPLPSPPSPEVRPRRWWIGVAAAGVAGAAVLAWSRTQRKTPPGSRIVVLPFTHAAGDEETAAVLHQDIIHRLGTLPLSRLAVIARTSSARYRAKNLSLGDLAKEVQAAYVLDGSINQNRTTVELIDPRTETQLWSLTYESSPDLAGKIAAGVTHALFPGGPSIVSSPALTTGVAAEQLNKGLYLATLNDTPGLRRAVEYFRAARDADAAAVQAHTGLAETLIRLAKRGAMPSRQSMPEAGDAARRAVALQSTSPNAHNALANVLFWYEWNNREAEQHFRRAIELAPGFALAYHDYAWLLLAVKQTEEALAANERARDLDPASPHVNLDTGWLLYRARRYEQAVKHCRRILELEPQLLEARGTLEMSLIQLGRQPFRPPPQPPASPYFAACLHALSGSKPEALQSLRQAIEQKQLMVALAGTEPAFDSLRADPEFQKLVAR